MPTKCFVPGCRTGYVKSTKKIGIFRPKHRLEIWRRKIPRTHRLLQETDVVCELHFEDVFIEKDYVHIIDGKEVRIPRGKTKLAADAIPTKFPGLPSYYSTKVKFRKKPKPRYTPVSKPRTGRKSNKAQAEVSPVANGNLKNITTSSQESLDPWSFVNDGILPGSFFRSYSGDGNTVCLSHIELDANSSGPKPVAVVQVCFHKNSVLPEVYIRSIKVENCLLLRGYKHTKEGVLTLLQGMAARKLCGGIPIIDLPKETTRSYLSYATLSKINCFNDTIFSKDCYGFHQEMCAKCYSIFRSISKKVQMQQRARTKRNRSEWTICSMSSSSSSSSVESFAIQDET